MTDGSVAGMLVRLVLSLSMVLTLMVFLARFLRHRQLGVGFGASPTARRKKALPLQVVSQQGLSRGSSLAVVRVSGQLLLLGVTEANVSVLRELEDEDQPEPEPQGQVSRAAAQGPSGDRARAGSVVEKLRQWTVRRG